MPCFRISVAACAATMSWWARWVSCTLASATQHGRKPPPISKHFFFFNFVVFTLFFWLWVLGGGVIRGECTNSCKIQILKTSILCGVVVTHTDQNAAGKYVLHSHLFQGGVGAVKFNVKLRHPLPIGTEVLQCVLWQLKKTCLF